MDDRVPQYNDSSSEALRIHGILLKRLPELSQVQEVEDLYRQVLETCTDICRTKYALAGVLHRDERYIRVICPIGCQLSHTVDTPVNQTTFQKAVEQKKPMILFQKDFVKGDLILGALPQSPESVLVAPVASRERMFALLIVPRLAQEAAFLSDHKRIVAALSSIFATVEVEVATVLKVFTDLITALGKAVDARDPYTAGHSARVAKYARAIAEHLELPPDIREQVEWAGYLHDIGKIGLSDSVLRGTGELSDEDYGKMKIHPRQTYAILWYRDSSRSGMLLGGTTRISVVVAILKVGECNPDLLMRKLP